MVYIFLGIDGVLAPLEGLQYPISHFDQETLTPIFDKEALETLENLVNKYEASIVISSGWRTDNRHEFQTKIINSGITDTLLGVIVGKTERLNNDYANRGIEIDKWMQDNAKPTDSYIIIDDDRRFLFAQKDKHLWTKSKTENDYWVLSKHHFNIACSIIDSQLNTKL